MKLSRRNKALNARPARPKGGLFVVASLLLTYGLIILAVILFSTGQFNKNQLTKLDLYQKSYEAVVLNYYGDAMNSIEAIAANPSTVNDVQADNATELTSSLANQRAFNDQFDSMLVFNRQGILVAISSNATTFYSNTTLTNHVSAAVRQAVLSHRPQITNAYLTISKRDAIAFAAPITDANGQYAGSVVGVSTLKGLPARLPFFTSFQGLTSTIVDSSGVVVASGGKQVADLENISNREPVLKELGNQPSIVRHEINYQGQNVIAQATKVPIAKIATISVISYVPQASFYDVSLRPVVELVTLLLMLLGLNIVLLGVLADRRALDQPI